MANKRRKAAGGPAAKRRKVSSKKTDDDVQVVAHRRHLRGRRGSLQDMPEMPLDILFDIFVHLEPFDLLNLARTSKPFRQLLMHRSAAPFWRAARQNVEDLPPCPPFLSEPAYANLLFDNYCHECLRPNIQTVYWVAMARYCKPCSKEMFYRSWEISGAFDEYTKKPLPDPDELLGCDGNYSLRRYKPYVKEIMKEWRRTKKPKYEEFVAKYSARYKELYSHSTRCEDWYVDRKDSRQKEIEDLREDRLEDILQRLRDLGYNRDIEYAEQAYPSAGHPLLKIPRVLQPKPLTDRAWKNMKEEVLSAMEEIRARRLYATRVAKIKRRIAKLEESIVPWRRYVGPISPPTQEFLVEPQVASLIDAPIRRSRKPGEDIDFSMLEHIFYDFTNLWRDRKRSEPSELVASQISLPTDVDPFSLAVSQYFHCTEPGPPGYRSFIATYPNFLVHRSSHEMSAPPAPGLDDTYVEIVSRLHGDVPTSVEKMNSLASTVRAVIEACNQDPTRVTVEEMDALDIRLRCTGVGCPEEGVCAVYTWRAAVEHRVSDRHSNKDELSWEQVPSEHFADIVTMEATAKSNEEARRKDFTHSAWICSRCPRTSYYQWMARCKRTHSSLIDHLRTEHNIDNPTKRDMYYDPWRHDRVNPVYFVHKDVESSFPRWNRISMALQRGEAKLVESSWFDSLQA
ncbi:unnamed protein product [Somion occarium]|uniref:F-box domain-containing protein n=1 Tax=Somion occarium TaxID=3059160 RepID=A0ABP1DJ84_9APHY